MNKDSKQMFWLGIFVVGGLTFLMVILYSLGDRLNFFDRTITLHAIFQDVSGLRSGNSVRLSGVNVGTVDYFEIIDDSSVFVTFIVQKDVQRYIRGNATASVATDGLMGNKLILIHPGKIGGPENDILVQDGDTLEREAKVEMDDMLAMLEQTNANVSTLSAELVKIIAKVSSGEGSLGKLIAEPDLVNGLEEAIAGIENFAAQGNETLLELNTAVEQINQGEGMVGALLSDSSMTNNLTETMINLQKATEGHRPYRDRNAGLATSDPVG
jgi:phospholipid/cholesterol/gamma-HCH transport system substrate-binding protein